MIQFNQAQIDRLSEMSGNFSLIIFASIVLPTITSQLELRPYVIGMAVMISLGSAVLSLTVLKGVRI